MKMNQINLLGIVGGNLTAALICLEATKKGIKTVLLDKNLGNIATQYATNHILAEATKENIEKLMLRVDAVIFCIENIAFQSDKKDIEVPVYPSRKAIEVLNNRAKLLTLATDLGIPTPNYYYQNNKEDVFQKIDSIQVPFTFYQIYENQYKAINIIEAGDIEEFLYGVDDKAEEWLIEQINDYQKILSITILKDKKGKICAYPVAEEMMGDEEVNYINIPADLTKTMVQKVTRYAKKLVKDIDTEGVFSLKFGMKKNKAIEFIAMSPGITIGDIASLHYIDMSVYEQYINMIGDIDIVEPQLIKPSRVVITKEDEEPVGMKLPYHLYIMDKDTHSPIKIYIKEEEQTE